MKGIVFNEFLDMVETHMGEEVLDDMLESVELDSDGVYTSIGTYSHEELLSMVVYLSERLDTPIPALVKTFGEHLGGVFTRKFTSFFEEAGDTISLLKSIDQHIHVEVIKLYPDAELPRFSYSTNEHGHFVLHYASKKGFGDLAEGLIGATMTYYKELYTLSRIDGVDGDLHTTDFTLVPA